MTVAEANKTLRHYRIQQMYKELERYKLSSVFIEEVLCSFFMVGPATIYRAMKNDLDLEYEYIELDREWAAGLVKIVLAKAAKAAKEQKPRKPETEKNKNQIKLNF